MPEHLVRRIVFDKQERARLARVCQILGTSFEELIHDAAMQAVDEVEGVVREAARVPAMRSDERLIRQRFGTP